MKNSGILVLLAVFFLSSQSYATPRNFDIFGVTEHTKATIYSCCSEMIEQYLTESEKRNFAAVVPNKAELVRRLRQEDKIIARINRMGDFAAVKISVVYYPADNQTYGTLDIVRAGDIARIPDKKREGSASKMAMSKSTEELFEVWTNYNEKYLQLIKENKLDSKKTSCPVLHCVWGFNKTDVKNMLPKLQKGVVQNKKELFEIIKNSSDDKQRGDAIFILANDNHYQELANFLSDFTDDTSDLVRNNTMRVLGAIVAKNKVPDLKLEKIIQALNYPYVTDRNKAAYVLLGIIKSNPETHAQVINKAGNTLLELLKLKQPNNHDYAYQILRTLSHKNYAERDYKNWSKWIKDSQQVRSESYAFL